MASQVTAEDEVRVEQCGNFVNIRTELKICPACSSALRGAIEAVFPAVTWITADSCMLKMHYWRRLTPEEIDQVADRVSEQFDACFTQHQT